MHLIPRVTHRRVDVADVQLVRRGQHSLGNQVAAADDKFCRLEVDLLNRIREQWQILLHVADTPGQVLNPTRQDGSSTQPTAWSAAFALHKGDQLRLSVESLEELINRLDNQFRSTG